MLSDHPFFCPAIFIDPFQTTQHAYLLFSFKFTTLVFRAHAFNSAKPRTTLLSILSTHFFPLDLSRNVQKLSLQTSNRGAIHNPVIIYQIHDAHELFWRRCWDVARVLLGLGLKRCHELKSLHCCHIRHHRGSIIRLEHYRRHQRLSPSCAWIPSSPLWSSMSVPVLVSPLHQLIL